MITLSLTLKQTYLAYNCISVNVYNQSALGNQHFCELLPRANDVINIYMTVASVTITCISTDFGQ